jgi:hypothetical protein
MEQKNKIEINLPDSIISSISRQVAGILRENLESMLSCYSSLPHFAGSLFYFDLNEKSEMGEDVSPDLSKKDTPIEKLLSMLNRLYGNPASNPAVYDPVTYHEEPDYFCNNSAFQKYHLSEIKYPCRIGLITSYSKALPLVKILSNLESIPESAITSVDSPSKGKYLLLDCGSVLPYLKSSRDISTSTVCVFPYKKNTIEAKEVLSLVRTKI